MHCRLDGDRAWLGGPCVTVVEGHTAELVVAAAFELGLVIETAGPDGEVVKLLPALTIDDDTLARGLDLLDAAVEVVVDAEGARLIDTEEKVSS